MKKFLIAFLVCVMCISLCALCACEEPIDPTTQSLEITNATQLTSKWNVGEADRQVEVALSDGLQDKELVVKAEPQGIISVDGTTLHAEKAGKATVTATVALDEEHVFSDSVEIEVSYNYSLQITNKADLTKAFRIGEERTVQVTVPEALQNKTVTLTSGQPTVVQVQGNKITAAAKGTATITASVKLDDDHVFSDKFDVTVWGAFDLTITNTDVTIGKNSQPIAIDYTLVEAGDYKDSDVTITSSDTNVATIEGKTVVPHECGTTTITVKCGSVSRQFTVTIEVQAELQLAEFDESKVYFVGEGEGKGCELPAIVKAINSLEQDVTSKVELTHDGLKIDSNVAIADHIGKYTITYTLHDIEGKPDKTATIHITFVEELFASTGAHAGNDKADDPLDAVAPTYALTGDGDTDYTQTTTFGSNALLFGKLDSTGSKQYYAEATFAVGFLDTDAKATIAFGHFNTEKDALLSTLNVWNGQLVTMDIKFNVSDAITSASQVHSGSAGTYSYFNARHFTRLPGDEGTDGGSDYCSVGLVKIAVLRDGDYFYTFINDQYANCVTSQALRDEDTIPAIVGKWLNKAQITVTNIEYVKEAQAVQTKMVELLGEHKEKMIVPFADSNNTVDGSHSGSFGNNVKIETNIENKGLAFTYTNGVDNDHSNGKEGSAFSPYVYFDGNFTISWDYKATAHKLVVGDPTDGDDSKRFRAILELKDASIPKKETLQFGFAKKDKKTSDTNYQFEMNVMGYDNSTNYKQWGQPSANNLNKLVLGTPTRFSITRILLEDRAVYVMTATVLNENGAPTNQTYTRTITWNNQVPIKDSDADYTTAATRWNYPMLAYWRNPTMSGEYSNMSWSLLANDVTAESVAQGENAKDVEVSTSETTYPETGGQSTTMTKFTLKVDTANRGDIVCKPNTQIEAGKYIVRIVAIGDTQIKPEISETVIYEKQVTLTAADYLKLGNLVLGHGTYEVRLIKVPAAA